MAGDETSDVMTPAIVLDEHDKAAVVALLIRTVRIGVELKRDRALVAEANERIAANTVTRSKTISAFGVFGFEGGDELWDHVAQSLGGAAYNRAIDIGKGEEFPTLLEKMGGGEANTKGSKTDDNQNAGMAVHAPPRIKDAILGHLREVGEAGTTARAVRQHLKDVHNLTVHEKTPGMTLYRLLKDGLVSRQGRTWYAKATAENNENEAPTARTEDASETALAAH